MKSIKSIKQATMRALFIFVLMPAVTWAGMKVDSTLQVDQSMIVKIIILSLASLCNSANF